MLKSASSSLILLGILAIVAGSAALAWAWPRSRCCSACSP